MAGSRLSLLPGEEVLVDIRPHWTVLLTPLVVASIAVAAGVGLDIGLPRTSVQLHWVEALAVAAPCTWLGVRAVGWMRRGIVLTPYRLFDVRGPGSRNCYEMRLNEIESVVVVRGMFERIIGRGALDLVLVTGEVHTVDDVRKPVVLQRVIDRRLGSVGPVARRPRPRWGR